MHPDIDHLLSQPFGSLPELIARQAALRPRHTALILDDQRLDYAALRAGMDRVAASLQRDGLRPGDVLAICAGASIEYMLAYLGALRAGVAVAPLAPSATAGHLSAMLDNCGAHLVLRDREVAAQWPLHDGPALHCVALDDAPEWSPDEAEMIDL
ncbi:MAG TPA: AMP-binding protein, partial [Alicycliphilus sp.]|nr:AMP-binding protein [Alicycliphilus sp.]